MESIGARVKGDRAKWASNPDTGPLALARLAGLKPDTLKNLSKGSRLSRHAAYRLFLVTGVNWTALADEKKAEFIRVPVGRWRDYLDQRQKQLNAAEKATWSLLRTTLRRVKADKEHPGRYPLLLVDLIVAVATFGERTRFLDRGATAAWANGGETEPQWIHDLLDSTRDEMVSAFGRDNLWWPEGRPPNPRGGRPRGRPRRHP